MVDSFGKDKGLESNGYIFRFNGNNYVVSLHHFLPILNTKLDLNSEIVELKKIKNINWNELSIYKCPDLKYLLNTKVIRKYRTRFPELNSIVKIEIKNRLERFEIVDYYNFCHNPLSKLRSIYIKIELGSFDENNRLNITNKFQGLSGEPVFDKDEKLIGTFCKIIFGEKFGKKYVYGLVLPTIYLTKSLLKKDNENIYYLDIEEFDLKLGKYEIQKDETNNFVIYSLQCNYKLPLDIFVIMEGDEDYKIMTKNTKTFTYKQLKFIKNNKFDFSLQLIKNEKNEYKLNTGFISALVKSEYKKQAMSITTRYYNSTESLNNIYLTI